MFVKKDAHENSTLRQMRRFNASDVAGTIGGIAFCAAGIGFIMAITPATNTMNIATGDRLVAAGIIVGMSAFGISKMLRK